MKPKLQSCLATFLEICLLTRSLSTGLSSYLPGNSEAQVSLVIAEEHLVETLQVRRRKESQSKV
jgi:hypothetical protein